MRAVARYGIMSAYIYMLPAAALASAENCITDAEIESAIGAQLRAGALAVRTDMLGEGPLCSGLTMARAVQSLHAKYFPPTDEVRTEKAAASKPNVTGNNTARADSPVPQAALTRYEGKYNFEKVGEYYFMQHPALVSALQKSGVSAAIRKELSGYEVSGPIEIKDGILISMGCFPNYCSEMHYKIYVNARTGVGALCHFKKQAMWYSANTSKPIRSTAPCPEHPGAVPAQVRQTLANPNSALRVSTIPAGNGRIWGEFSYPSDYMPEDITACAEDIASSREVCVKRSTVQGDRTFYSVTVPPGRYRVYARTADAPGKKAYYSRSVVCGKGTGGELGCKDHTPVILTVTHGSVHSEINPQDWYAD